MKLLLALFAMIFTLGACSTISDRESYSYPLPPSVDVWGRDPLQVDEKLEKQHLADPSNRPLLILVRYQQAKLWQAKDPVKACALWTEVLAEPRFPLARIARLRAMENCPTLGSTIDDAMSTNPEAWLSELLLRSTLARAKSTGDKAWEMRLSLKVADLEKLQSEKVKLLQRSKELASSLGDTQTEAAAQNKIEGLAPRFITNPPSELWLRVAQDFKQAREFDRARAIYDKVVEGDFTPFDKLKALDGIRMTYKLEKNTDAYLEGSQKYSDFARKNLLKRGLKTHSAPLLQKYFDTRMTLARAVWTEGRPSDAQKILLATEREVHGRIPVYESVLIHSRIEEEAGNYEKTLALLNEIDADKVANHDLKLKILWYRAWDARKAGKLKESADQLASLAPQEDSTMLGARDRFWYAKTLKELGKPSDEEFQKVIDADNLGWYSLLAYREMNQAIPALVAPRRLASKQSAFMPEEKLMFEWLLAGGENDLAKKFLDQVTQDRKATYTEAQTLDLLQSYARAGYFQALFARLYELPADQRKDLLATNPELLFPQPWTDLVKTASAKFDVQTELIYSIMRQESSFNPLARSPADAFGLMQLIPEMAKKAEQTAGIQIESHEDLYTPETNIPLGTAFVHDLLEKWHGGFIPTVASYNASEKAIVGWVKSRYKGNTLEFIEDVPYEETRNYIKLVMRNFIFYKRLNSGGAPVPFPEWCLANLQDVTP